jgi:hypothetical protein
MDTPDTFWLDTNPDDNYWEAYYRRDYSERDKLTLLEAMSETFRSDKEAWDDLRRRERMEQIMYDV